MMEPSFSKGIEMVLSEGPVLRGVLMIQKSGGQANQGLS